jgi:YidC/Oxa1 family membrane protein insertase
MKALQAKYKDDKVRQQQEMQKFYKENNLNPLGACLPMVLQLPVFFALYAMLRESLRNDICPQVQLHHQQAYAAAHHISVAAASSQTVVCGANAPGAGFLFIPDLTARATGWVLVVLMILYVGSQLSSSLLMTATADKSQRQLMLVMPLIFVAFIFRFPAGLLVYWITTNLWTIGQQYIVRKRMGVTRTAMESSGAIPAGSANLASGANRSDEGLITMLRRKMSEGQQPAPTKKSSGGSSGSDGGSRASATKATPKATPKTPQRSRAGANRAGSKPSAEAKNGSGTTKATGNGNGNGNGAAATPSGSGSASQPPRPPRKRKKRSGRRR